MTRPHPSPASHRWTDWSPGPLVEEKRRRGLRVSVVVPARDEAATVGGIVARLRADLVEATPLVDEVVVIDSDSSDATAEAARAAGATVHAAADIRPDLGARPGKGEAMWKSLFVATGDLLVFMDADLTEWDTHFVTGLLGPLLTDDGVDLVKGFYDRPMAADAAGGRPVAPSEGGRVTELVARPLLALHWPELAGVVQPLAGEWAVRRRLLERVPVPTGYAVELSLLLDAYAAGGVGAIAQVDLGVRRHGHQSLRDLGAMALQILALAKSRTAPGGPRETGSGAGEARGDVPETLTLQQFGWEDGVAVPEAREVDLRQRPPAVSVPGYRRSAGVRPDGQTVGGATRDTRTGAAGAAGTGDGGAGTGDAADHPEATRVAAGADQGADAERGTVSC